MTLALGVAAGIGAPSAASALALTPVADVIWVSDAAIKPQVNGSSDTVKVKVRYQCTNDANTQYSLIAVVRQSRGAFLPNGGELNGFYVSGEPAINGSNDPATCTGEVVTETLTLDYNAALWENAAATGITDGQLFLEPSLPATIDVVLLDLDNDPAPGDGISNVTVDVKPYKRGPAVGPSS
jgi:hypothetical protein